MCKLIKLLKLLKRKWRKILMSIFAFDDDKNKVEILKDTGWIKLAEEGTEFSMGTSTASVSQLEYRVKDGVLYVNFDVVAYGTMQVTIGTLPEGHRPNRRVICTTGGVHSTPTRNVLMQLTVNTDGTITSNAVFYSDIEPKVRGTGLISIPL